MEDQILAQAVHRNSGQPGHSTRPRFHLLDGIRGLAALLVALRHTEIFFGSFEISESYLAVDIFFLLSGVVICNAYEERLLGSMSFAEFLKIRLIRIYPLFLLGCLISCYCLLRGYIDLGTPRIGLSVLLGLLLLPVPFHAPVMVPLNTPGWSLHFELLVNFVYARLIRRMSQRAVAVIIALAAVGLMFSVMRFQRVDFGVRLYHYPAGLCRTTYSFFLGIFLYRHFSRQAARPVRQIKSNRAAWLLLGVVGSLLMATPSLSLRPYYDFAAVTVIFPVIIYCAMRVQPHKATKTIFVFLGTISYALYVLHKPVGDLVAALCRNHGVSVEAYAPLSGAVLLIFLVGLCAFLDKVYDAPLRAFLLRTPLLTWPAGILRRRRQLSFNHE